MRIGIELLALQSPGSRGRGVGRYARQLVGSLLRSGSPHSFVLYVHHELSDDHVPDVGPAEVVRLRPDVDPAVPTLAGALEHLARVNPDGLDWLVTLNPFEQVPGFDPPARPSHGPRLAAVVYDLIPFLFPERYLADPTHSAWMHRRLRALRHYDRLLAISESTRADCLHRLKLPAQRVVNIRGAVDSSPFHPAAAHEPATPAELVALGRLGIRQAFVFCLGGDDWRKNLDGLVEAFARLPAPLRQAHQLVLACRLSDAAAAALRDQASRLGIGAHLVLAGEVPDSTLALLYRRCAAFAFPSRYEGLGLPLLEAMHSGAGIVACRNSSQPEVVGNAGLLAEDADPAAFAAQLARLLRDPVLRRKLGQHAVARAATFRWSETARRTLAALESPIRARLTPRRPRLAVFSPWPPKGSGIGDYATRLVQDLKRHYVIDLFHEPGYVPEPTLAGGFAAHDYRLFGRLSRARGYHAVLHQMGNSFYHAFVHEALVRHPGIVTLHDFNLAGFHWWRSSLAPEPLATFADEVAASEPEQAAAIIPQLAAWAREPGGMQEAFTRRRLYLNRRVLQYAQAVVVHSPWCLERIAAQDPALARKTAVIRHGATPEPPEPARRRDTRVRFDLPSDALLIGCFGILAQSKMNVEAIDVFAAMRPELPVGTLLLFVGQDWENGQAQAHAQLRGLGGAVRFLGRQDDASFLDLVTAVDMAFALRRPPTYGETSGALLHLLRNGVPSIVTDTDTFADYPDTVVRKVRWETEGPAGLAVALMELATSPARRADLSAAALAYVGQHHHWARVTEDYVSLIEAASRAARARPPVGASRPHHVPLFARLETIESPLAT